MREWFRLARGRSVVVRATGCALVVGTILLAINHGDLVLGGEVTAMRVVRMGLTVLVPYCVSTYSSVAALRADLAARR